MKPALSSRTCTPRAASTQRASLVNAVALGVPIGAFFLPPEDDGRDVRYLFHPHEQGADCMGMADLMAAGFKPAT